MQETRYGRIENEGQRGPSRKARKWGELINYGLKITWRQITKNKINFGLGFCACLVVVVVICVLLTLLANTPIVFLRLSELQAGEFDYMIKVDSGAQGLNYTLITQLATEAKYKYSAPRILLSNIDLYKESSCDAEMLKIQRETGDITWRYTGPNGDGPSPCKTHHTCLTHYCKTSSSKASLFLIDFDREREMGLGRTWTLPNLKKGEIYLSSGLKDQLGMNNGEALYIHYDTWYLLNTGWNNVFGNHTTEGANHYDVFARVEMPDSFDDVHGKFSDDLENIAMMDINTFISHTGTQLDPISLPSIIDKYKSVNVQEYVSQVMFNLPPESRLKYYLDTDYDQIQKNVGTFGANVAYKIGFNVVDMSTPILPRLFAFRFLSIFLGLIFNVIITVLLFICIILIYSLLSTTLEARSFETAVHRMFGMDAAKIVLMLLLQGLCYSIPSLPAGALVAQGATALAIHYFGEYIGVQLSPWLSMEAIVYAGIVVITIPIVSSAIPIASVLNESLITSLQPSRSKTKAVEVSINRAEMSNFSWSWAIVGFALTIFGVSIYYLLPYSLLSLNLQLLLNLFVVLLLGMLFGMSLFTLNLQTIGERILVHVLFFWEKRGIKSIVLKNLVAHRVANRQTAALYSVSISFICFILVSYNLQINTLLYQIQRQRASYITVYMRSPDWATVSSLESFVTSKNNIVDDYAWRSFGLEYLLTATTRATNIGRTFSANVWVTAVSPNYFNVSIPGFLVTEEYTSTIDPLQNLYSAQGSHGAMVGSMYKKLLGLHLPSSPVDHDSDFLIEVNVKNKIEYHRIRPIGFVDGAPGLVMSPFPVVVKQDILVSIPTMMRMINSYNRTSITDMANLPLRTMTFKLKESITDGEKDGFIKDLNGRFSGRVWVWDYRKQIQPISIATLIVAYFFNITTAMAMIVCFFSLNSTMFNSIYSQVKEISILRALGISKFWMYRIYIYESIILVLLSSLFGLVVGSLIGYTMTIQGTLFTQLPVPFVFPTDVLVIVLVSSIILSVLASFSPTRHLLKMSVVSLMKYTN